MEFQYLGTAAAEGVPALWCNCETCRKSRKIGGRAIRTRSQAIIDGKLLIDFPADTYMHVLQNGIDLLNVEHCIVTHSHSDHLYADDICMIRPGFAHLPQGYKMTFHGTAKMAKKLLPAVTPIAEQHGCVGFEEIVPLVPVRIAGYEITALPAIHDSNAGPVFYQISDGDKTVLYANDTHFFHEDVWAYWEKTKPHFDMVSLDCTNSCLPLTYVGHMSLYENVRVREKMLEMGIADEKTVFICHHFSHNGTHATYDDFVPQAAKEGFLVSYDGMKLTL